MRVEVYQGLQVRVEVYQGLRVRVEVVGELTKGCGWGWRLWVSCVSGLSGICTFAVVKP